MVHISYTGECELSGHRKSWFFIGVLTIVSVKTIQNAQREKKGEKIKSNIFPVFNTAAVREFLQLFLLFNK